MKILRLFAAILACILIVAPLRAQKQTPEPLTEAQQEKIAEAGIDPDARIALYTKYANQRADILKGLINRHEAGRARRIDGELQVFVALLDELSSNLDEYGDRKADLRKSLKSLYEAVARWQGILRDLPKDSFYETSRRDATEAVNDLANDTKKLIAEQQEYFKTHKESKGQEREEPK